MLSQLIYVSKRAAACTDEEIQQILQTCQLNNAHLGVTGVLLYSPSKFLQYIEGDSKQIMALYDKIKLDKRHSNSVILSYGPLRERYFPSWQMGAKQLLTQESKFDSSMSEAETKEFQSLLAGVPSQDNRGIQLIRKFFN